MSRRQRQHDELRRLCRSGAVSRAIDLAFEHFADFGRDDEILRLLADAIEHAPPVIGAPPQVRRVEPAGFAARTLRPVRRIRSPQLVGGMKMQMVQRPESVSRVGTCAAVALVGVALLGGAACSSSSKTTSKNSEPTVVTTTTTTQPRPAGPTADMSRELTGANGVFIGSATPANVDQVGYVEREYVAAGTASSYTLAGKITSDGRWNFAPGATAPYRTRVVVRQPADPEKFSGTAVLEWLNVSGGVDADPDWVSLHEEIVRRGDAWIGVSTQRIGIEGGPVIVKVDVPGSEAAGKGLKTIDPARYGSLEHPGDGFAFDIFTQVARAIRAGDLHPKRVVAAGESQSAFALVTYYNGVQPLAHAFDGFFVHSRGAGGLPLVGPGKYAGIADAISGTTTIFRADQDAPVLDIQTETDVASVLNSFAARQPDTNRFRLWEVAGTADADKHLVGGNSSLIKCGVPINDGPMHLVAKAAWRALTKWLDTGTPPAVAPRIEVTPGESHEIRRTADGIALGGIRTPPVDVPIAALSGAPGPQPSTICLLLGSTKPFTDAQIARRYSSRADYLDRYDAAADATIKAGFVLAEDRAALLGFADRSRIPAGYHR